MSTVGAAGSPGISIATQYTNREIYDIQNNPTAAVQKEVVIGQLRGELTTLQSDKDALKAKLDDLKQKASVTQDELRAAQKDVAQAIGRYNQVENQLAYLENKMPALARNFWEQAVLNPPRSADQR